MYDLKVMDTEDHRTYTGVTNELILANLSALAGGDAPIEIRIPMIPDITDSRENLEAVDAFLRPLRSVRRISLLPYNKLGDDKLERYGIDGHARPWTTPEESVLEERRQWLSTLGYDVKIGG